MKEGLSLLLIFLISAVAEQSSDLTGSKAISRLDYYPADSTDSLPGSISGTVTDYATGYPMSNVEVKADPADTLALSHGSAYTDSMGYYRIDSLYRGYSGLYQVTIEADSWFHQSIYPEVIDIKPGEVIEVVDLIRVPRDSLEGSISGQVRLLDYPMDTDYWQGMVSVFSSQGFLLGQVELEYEEIVGDRLYQNYLIENLPMIPCYVVAQVHGYLPQYYDHSYTIELAQPVYPDAANIDFDMEVAMDSLIGGVWGVVYGDHEGPLPYTAVYAKNGNQLASGVMNLDPLGYYAMRLVPGIYTIYATRAGYETGFYIDTITVANQMIPSINIFLTPGSGIDETEIVVPQPGIDVFPNPFATNARIKYSLSRAGLVSVRIFDVTGSRVCSLADQYQNPGQYHLDWNGIDSEGVLLPSGVYFCRVNQGGAISTAPLVILR